MTPEQIKQGNRLIADSPFSHPELRKGIKADMDAGISPDLAYADLKYHSSWNWLMPVVKNIKELRTNNQLPKNTLAEKLIAGGMLANNISGVLLSLTEVDEQVTFEECVEFITWYNEVLNRTKP